MDNMDTPRSPAPGGAERGTGAGGRLLGSLTVLLIVGAVLGVLGIRSSRAAGTVQVAVDPPTKSQLYYQPTPMTFTIAASELSGAGNTPVSGYQYALSWDPAVLQWMSGPKVGAGTPTPAPVLNCSNNPQIRTWGTPTATPTDFVPTYTPTKTNTPGAGTPTNTPTETFTPTLTPTPGGYILVGCATISGTAVPSGVLGTFTFLPLVTGPAATNLDLLDLVFVTHDATPVPVSGQGGYVAFVDCADINGDGSVNGLDLGQLATHFLQQVGNPDFLPAADLNGDGGINGLDLGVLAASFLLSC